MAFKNITAKNPRKELIVAAIRKHCGLPSGVGRVTKVQFDEKNGIARANVIHKSLPPAGYFRCVQEVRDGIVVPFEPKWEDNPNASDEANVLAKGIFDELGASGCSFTSKDHRGNELTLVFEESGKPVLSRQVVRDFRGNKAFIRGGRAPHKQGSTGKVFVSDVDCGASWRGTDEYYPGVFGLVWADLNESKVVNTTARIDAACYDIVDGKLDERDEGKVFSELRTIIASYIK